jgi:hypothetical protein
MRPNGWPVSAVRLTAVKFSVSHYIPKIRKSNL